MPVDLPLRQPFGPAKRAADAHQQRLLNRWAVALAALCFTIALADCVMLTPPSQRAGFDTAIYQAMFQAP